MVINNFKLLFGLKNEIKLERVYVPDIDKYFPLTLKHYYIINSIKYTFAYYYFLPTTQETADRGTFVCCVIAQL